MNESLGSKEVTSRGVQTSVRWLYGKLNESWRFTCNAESERHGTVVGGRYVCKLYSFIV